MKPVNREQQNTKKPVVDAVESSSISNKETIVNQKAEKRKSEQMAFSSLVRETKSKSNVEATVSENSLSIAIKLPYICFFFQCCNHHKEVCAMLKADEDKLASLIQAHVNTVREYNKKPEQRLRIFKTLVGFVVVYFCLNILSCLFFSRVRVLSLRLLKKQMNHLLRQTSMNGLFRLFAFSMALTSMISDLIKTPKMLAESSDENFGMSMD